MTVNLHKKAKIDISSLRKAKGRGLLSSDRILGEDTEARSAPGDQNWGQAGLDNGYNSQSETEADVRRNPGVFFEL